MSVLKIGSTPNPEAKAKHYLPHMHSISRITVNMQATQNLAWPHFAGSTLRGAFGRALRQAACVTGKDTCIACPLRQSCAYGVVFDPVTPKQVLHPSFQNGVPRYILQPPALGACKLVSGQRQSFTLVLLPGSHTHYKLVLHTLQATVEKHLMKPGMFKLEGVIEQHEQLTSLQAAASEKTEAIHNPPTQVTLRWLTPLRLQYQGKPIFNPQMLNATLLVRSMLRRHLQWCQLTDETPPDSQAFILAASESFLDTSNLRWHEIERYSEIQKEKLPLGGLMGSATLHTPAISMQTLIPLIQLVEHLHIGKESVMGLGRFQLSYV